MRFGSLHGVILLCVFYAGSQYGMMIRGRFLVDQCNGANIMLESKTPPTNNHVITSYVPPYAPDWCDSKPIGEKQIWNPRKKVISYSLHAEAGTTILPDWLHKGVIMVSRSALTYFPDWIVRIYTVGVSKDIIAGLLAATNNNNNVEIVQCHDNTILTKDQNNSNFSSRLRMTRFLAIDDPTVDMMMSRDLDSRFSPRELMAVNAWMGSDSKFHSMRDHKFHDIPILAGMFDMKKGLDFGTTKEYEDDKDQPRAKNITMTDLIKMALEKAGTGPIGGGSVLRNHEDQSFLSTYIWPLVKNETLAHDMNAQRCTQFKSKECTDFPLGPRNEESSFFVGMPFKNDQWNSDYDCTIECKASHDASFQSPN